MRPTGSGKSNPQPRARRPRRGPGRDDLVRRLRGRRPRRHQRSCHWLLTERESCRTSRHRATAWAESSSVPLGAACQRPRRSCGEPRTRGSGIACSSTATVGRHGPISGRVVVRDLGQTWAGPSPGRRRARCPANVVAEIATTMPDNVRCVATHLQPHACRCGGVGALQRRHEPFDLVLTQNFTPVVGPGVPSSRRALQRTRVVHRVERAYFAAIPVLARRARSC